MRRWANYAPTGEGWKRTGARSQRRRKRYTPFEVSCCIKDVAACQAWNGTQSGWSVLLTAENAVNYIDKQAVLLGIAISIWIAVALILATYRETKGETWRLGRGGGANRSVVCVPASEACRAHALSPPARCR
jgi:hypothetical protein